MNIKYILILVIPKLDKYLVFFNWTNIFGVVYLYWMVVWWFDEEEKFLYGDLGLILLALIITFITDTAGIRTFTSKVLGFNNSIDVNSLPKITSKIDDLVLLDNGNLYRQTNDLFELKLESIGAIASDDMFYYYYINGNELMYVDKTTTDFIGISLLDYKIWY